MIVHERQLFLVPDGLPDEQAALLESAASAVHAALRRQPQPGEQALVMGTDVEGLLLIQALRAFAPNADIAALLDAPYHAEMAARMGASQTLRADEVPEGIARITGSKRLSNAHGAELFIGGFDVSTIPSAPKSRCNRRSAGRARTEPSSWLGSRRCP